MNCVTSGMITRRDAHREIGASEESAWISLSRPLVATKDTYCS